MMEDFYSEKYPPPVSAQMNRFENGNLLMLGLLIFTALAMFAAGLYVVTQ